MYKYEELRIIQCDKVVTASRNEDTAKHVVVDYIAKPGWKVFRACIVAPVAYSVGGPMKTALKGWAAIGVVLGSGELMRVVDPMLRTMNNIVGAPLGNAGIGAVSMTLGVGSAYLVGRVTGSVKKMSSVAESMAIGAPLAYVASMWTDPWLRSLNTYNIHPHNAQYDAMQFIIGFGATYLVKAIANYPVKLREGEK